MASSKFKPALAGPAATRSKPNPTTPPHHKKPTHTMAALSREDSMVEILDGPSALTLPAKRISADLPDRPQSAPSKRFKPSLPINLHHVSHKTPKGKAASSSRHWSPERGETSSEVDSLNLGLVRIKLPADPFKFSRKLPPSASSPFRPVPPRNFTPQRTSPDFPDLNSKSLDDLKSFLSTNLQVRDMLTQLISDHIQNVVQHDIISLSNNLSQVDDRIRSLKQRIASLETVDEIEEPPRSLPAPFPMLSSASTSTSKKTDTGRTPPPSMAVSDSSNTTLDTITTVNAPSNTIQDTLMTIDSPEVVELDLQDVSAQTLVVDDSDDAYYDKFDPIPADLILFDTEELEVSRPSGTASTPVSASSMSVVPVTSGGRIDHTSTPYYTEVISILKNTFKLSSFRTNQLECIVATLDGKDVFYLAPTGGGKSLCFQLPALCVTGKTQGTTFVISPLISLITDQVAALRKKGVPAFPLTSAAEENEVRQAMRMMRSNVEEKPKLVYTTPERFQKSDSLKDVVDQLYEEKQLARFVIDEAHVIGSWGRDFRASYAELNILRKNWPNVPIMALTGSANKDAIEDIKHNLAMRDPKPALKKDLVQSIAGFIKTHHPNGTGIIYALSRAESEEMAQKLREEWGIEARHYHAGIDNEERKINQDNWMAGRCKVIVATIAFGMGIDKPDVRFVIHATLSKDMDGYYQETGRAGRDGKASDCVLFYTYSDAVKIEKILRNPNNDHSRDKPSDVEIERQVAKLQGVVAYCGNESDCRRVLLLRHFDEEFKPEDCHNQCDNCHRPGTLIQQDFTTEAQQVIQLLQDMMAVNGRGVTQSQLKDTWKGKNNKPVQQYKGLSLYAAGRALSHPTVERIFSHLATEGAISMYRVTSSSGYANTYIQPGSAAADYLEGGKRLVVSWKEKQEDAKESAKKQNTKPAPRKKGKEPDPQPVNSYLNLYEDIEDADDPSDTDAFNDAIDNANAPEPTTCRILQVGTSWSAGSADRSTALRSKRVAVPEDDPAARLERLKETRRMISEKFGKYPVDVILQDDTLQLLALTDPQDEQAFQNILMDCEEPDEVENKWKSYGREFLAALRDPFSTRKVFDTTKMRRDFAFNG